METYLLDSNVFIQAHRMYYPVDVVPGFWNKLEELSAKKTIVSIDKVKKELCDTSNPDFLSTWCTGKVDAGFFAGTTSCVDKYAEIAIWIQSHILFSQNAKDEFLSVDLADPWLIAYAMKNKCVIVTHEISQPQRKNKIKIPEPCIYFGIRFINPIQMFRELGETF